MRKIRALAPAKINLTFDILGDLPGGYHQIETLLQSIDLRDDITLTVEESDRFECTITCTNEIVPKGFPVDESNLMVKAARLFLKRANKGDRFKLRIEIEKDIPVGAGLAGGSTDGAAILTALNELFDRPFSKDELLKLGCELGADVPFCIEGGTCIGTNRGDVLQKVESKLDLSFCVVKPRALSVSTAWAYGKYDQFEQKKHKPDISGCVKALTNGDLKSAVDSFGNVFEPVIFREHPQLDPLKQQMLKEGCWSCHLSGSGPALYAIVADREQAHAIRRKMLNTEDLEFDYVRLSMPDLGPPIEFYIAQSCTSGVTLTPPIPQASK